jgi:hypothetical protein
LNWTSETMGKIIEDWNFTALQSMHDIGKDPLTAPYGPYGLPFYAALHGMMKQGKKNIDTPDITLETKKGHITARVSTCYSDTRMKAEEMLPNIMKPWGDYIASMVGTLQDPDFLAISQDVFALREKYRCEYGVADPGIIADILPKIVAKHPFAPEYRVTYGMGTGNSIIHVSKETDDLEYSVRGISYPNHTFDSEVSVAQSGAQSGAAFKTRQVELNAIEQQVKTIMEEIATEINTQYPQAAQKEAEFRVDQLALEAKIQTYYTANCAPDIASLKNAREFQAAI